MQHTCGNGMSHELAALHLLFVVLAYVSFVRLKRHELSISI